MGFLTRALSCSVCVVLPTVVLASSLLFSWIMFVQHSHKVATVLPIPLPVCESVPESGVASVFCTAQRHTHELFQQHLASCEHYHQFQALAFQAGSTLMNQMEQVLPGTTQEELAVTTCVTILTAIFFSWVFCVYTGRKMMSKRSMKKHVSWDEASFHQHVPRFEKEEEEKDHFLKEEVFGDVSDCVDSPQHMEEVLQLKQIIEKTQKKMGDLLQENGDLKIQLATRSPRLQESPEAAIVKLEAQVQELLNLKENLSEYKGRVSQALEILNQNESKYEKTLKELEERITQHRELNHYLEEAKTQVLKEIQQIKDALADDEQQNNASKQESVVATTQVVAPKVSTPRDTSKLKKTFLSKFKLIDDTPQASNNTVVDRQAQSQDNAPQKIEEEQHTETQSQSQEQQVTAVQQIDSLVTQLEEALAFEATKTEDEQTATQQEEEENASILLKTSTVDTSDLVGVDSPMGFLSLTTTTTTDSNVDEDVDSFLAASPVRDSSANEVPVLEVVAPVVEKDSPAEQTQELTDVQTSVVQESSKSSDVETDETETTEQTL